MKTQIIQTQFLDDVIFETYDVLYCLGIKGIRPNAEWVFNHIDLMYDLVHRCVAQSKAELASLIEGDDCPSDQLAELESSNRMMIDLSIIQDLEVSYYANPRYINNAVLILSEKLSEQLQAKALGETYYDEYYCKRLASVLAELCELVRRYKQC